MTLTWTVWALLLISHGAFTRWARRSTRYSTVSILSDALLIVIGVITLNQLQDASRADYLRIGIFFVAFGFLGRQMMGSMLRCMPVKAPQGTPST